MVDLRSDKIKGIAKDIPLAEVDGDQEGDLLIVGWGGTYGAIADAVHDLWAEGINVSYCHLKYLNPFPSNFGEILGKFKRILIPELNSGQLKTLIASTYLKSAEGLNKVQGLPLKAEEVVTKVKEMLNLNRVN
jgi:2-oxoglutarate ferredoxin oxidoreductase subunit alpha